MNSKRCDFACMMKISPLPEMFRTRAHPLLIVALLAGSMAQFGCDISGPTASTDVIGQRLEFKAGGNTERYRVSGWSAQEPNFIWSEGTSAKLALPISAAAGGVTIKVNMAALNHPPELPTQPVELYANGQKVTEWQVGDLAEFTAALSGEITKAGGTLNLEFRTPKAASPKSLGVNADTRVLGICLTSLELIKTT